MLYSNAVATKRMKSRLQNIEGILAERDGHEYTELELAQRFGVNITEMNRKPFPPRKLWVAERYRHRRICLHGTII